MIVTPRTTPCDHSCYFAANQQTGTSEEWTLDSGLSDSDEIKPLHLNFRCFDSDDLKRIIMSGPSERGKKNKPLHLLAEYLGSSCFQAHI